MDNSNIVIIRPIMSKEQFLPKLVEILHQNNIAPEALEVIDSSKVTLKYVTGYQFKGTGDCSYSAQTAGDLEITINDKKTTIKNGTPISGSIDNISFDIAVPIVGDTDSNWAKAMAQSLRYTTFDNTVTVNDIKEIGEDVAGNFNANALDFWVKNSNAILDNMMAEPAYALASSNALLYQQLGIIGPEMAMQMAKMGGTIDIQNLRVKSRNNLQEYGQKVLIPCYVLEFKFQNNDFFVACCVCKEKLQYTLGIPRRKTSNLTPEEQACQEMPDKAKIMKIANWGWILAVAAIFIKLWLAAVVLGLWFGAKWYLSKDIKARAKEIEASRAASSENLKLQIAKKLGVR